LQPGSVPEVEKRSGGRDRALRDPCVIAYLLRPALFGGREVNVAIETQSPLTLGMTVVDWWGVTGRKADVRLLHTVDTNGFYDLLTERLGRLRKSRFAASPTLIQ